MRLKILFLIGAFVYSNTCLQASLRSATLEAQLCEAIWDDDVKRVQSLLNTHHIDLFKVIYIDGSEGRVGDGISGSRRDKLRGTLFGLAVARQACKDLFISYYIEKFQQFWCYSWHAIEIALIFDDVDALKMIRTMGRDVIDSRNPFLSGKPLLYMVTEEACRRGGGEVTNCLRYLVREGAPLGQTFAASPSEMPLTSCDLARRYNCDAIIDYLENAAKTRPLVDAATQTED